LDWVEVRQMLAPSDDHVELNWFPTEGSQFGDRSSGSGDGEPLTFGGAVNDGAAVVA
jgi:hypothetical protein